MVDLRGSIFGLKGAVGAACLLMLPGVHASAAASFCNDLDNLARAGDGEVTLVLPDGPADQLAECRTALSMGGQRDLHCSWSFDYRSQAAIDAFENVTREVTQCLGPDAVQSTDQQVNHPDSYDLRLFNVEGREFAVSLKDKGALQQTLIFLRVPLTAKP